MKLTTIYLEENKIEIFNSLLGKEKIKVNNEIVSEKFSFSGTEHHFKIKENDEFKDCKIKIGFGAHGVVFSLYKENQPIIESNENKGCFVVFMIIGLAIGFLIGFYFL